MMSAGEHKKKKSTVRVLLDSFRNKELVSVAYKLKEKGIDIAYWTGGGRARFWHDARADTKNFPDTIFHNGLDCIQGIPADGVDSSKFEPLSRDFIHEMAPCESQVLSMMNAFDYSGVSVSRKKQIYYEYLRYWRGVLTHYNIDAVLFHDIPHSAYDYVIWHLAEKFSIKSIMYYAQQLPDRVLFVDDFLEFNEVKDAYAAALAEHVSPDALSPDLRAYYYSQVNSSDTKDNFHHYFIKGRDEAIANATRPLPSFRAVLRNLSRRTFSKTAYWYIKMLFHRKNMASLDGLTLRGIVLRKKFYEWNKIKNNFRKEYARYAQKPDFSKKFVYVPLHMQPERSTSAQGDVFVSQKLMLDILSAALPEGWMLYVKEHAAQFAGRRAHLGRYPQYYRELSRMKNLVMVPTDMSGRELLERAEAVATITGTSSWEAVLSGTPALMFGYNWQMHCDGIFRVNEVRGARKALEKIKNGYVPDAEKVLAFLVAIDRVSVRGYERVRRNRISDISEEEAAEHLFQAFYKRLSTL